MSNVTIALPTEAADTVVLASIEDKSIIVVPANRYSEFSDKYAWLATVDVWNMLDDTGRASYVDVAIKRRKSYVDDF
jgi:hypothetical protein